MRRIWVASIALLLGGCPEPAPDPAALEDLAAPADLAEEDLSVADLAPPPDLHPCAPDVAYPPGPYGTAVGDVAADLRFRDEAGGDVWLRSFYRGACEPRARLLLLRAQAAWCGPCQWHAAHTAELQAGDLKDRVTVADLLILDEQNRRARPGALAAFAARYDQRPAGGLLADADHQLRPIGVDSGGAEPRDLPLPLLVALDVRTMRIEAVLGAPDPDTLAQTLRRTLARLDGRPEPPLTPPALVDGRFTRDRWDLIRAMALPASLPRDPTNRYEDNADAVALGRRVFNDRELSPNPSTASCGLCHQQENFRADGKDVAIGYDPMGRLVSGDRSTPWLGGVSLSRFQFWDGRVDSLWAQALGPPENEREFSSTRLRVVHTVLDRYGAAYAKVFGAPPDLSDAARFPADGKPGQPAWDNMAAADQRTVNQVYANIGKAIAAFVRLIQPAPVALDRYLGGEAGALSAEEKDGLAVFFDRGCAHCHHGPLLSDGAFHNTRSATGRQDRAADRGRIDGVAALLASEFRGDGPFSDAPMAATWLKDLAQEPEMLGQSKTSALRGIADTAPYGHGGDMLTLEAVVDRYAQGGLPDTDARATGTRDLAMPRFDRTDPKNALLVRFLKTLKGTLIEPP